MRSIRCHEIKAPVDNESYRYALREWTKGEEERRNVAYEVKLAGVELQWRNIQWERCGDSFVSDEANEEALR